ncbi:MAG: ABC transporter ATP-binding protein [Myxococcota bacterium]
MEIRAQQLHKSYERDDMGRVCVLQGVDLHVATGEMVAITGASGVGKSTLLHLLGTLDCPDAGSLQLGATNPACLNQYQLAQFRNRCIGFVFQFHHLLPELTAQENVAIPLMICGTKKTTARQHASNILQQVGLQQRLHHKPSQLSGGEQQRVALARALVTNPSVILADEPTGNLDEPTGRKIIELLQQVQRQKYTTIVIVTHNSWVSRQASRQMVLCRDGLHAV